MHGNALASSIFFLHHPDYSTVLISVLFFFWPHVPYTNNITLRNPYSTYIYLVPCNVACMRAVEKWNRREDVPHHI